MGFYARGDVLWEARREAEGFSKNIPKGITTHIVQ